MNLATLQGWKAPVPDGASTSSPAPASGSSPRPPSSTRTSSSSTSRTRCPPTTRTAPAGSSSMRCVDSTWAGRPSPYGSMRRTAPTATGTSSRSPRARVRSSRRSCCPRSGRPRTSRSPTSCSHSSSRPAGSSSGAIGIDVQIEDATGLVHCEAIAAAPRVEALHFGPGDFSAAVGIPTTTIGGSPEGYPGDHLNHVYSRILDRGARGGRPGDRRPVRRPRRRRGPADQGAPRARARLRRQVVDPPRSDRRRSTRSSRRPTPSSPARRRSWPPTGRPRRAPRASRARWSTRRAARWPRGSSGPVALRDAFRPAARRMADDTRSPKRQPVGHDVRIRVVLKPIPR